MNTEELFNFKTLNTHLGKSKGLNPKEIAVHVEYQEIYPILSIKEIYTLKNSYSRISKSST